MPDLREANMDTNSHGVPIDKLVISIYSEHIMAKKFIEAIRDLQKRAPGFASQLDEPTLSDKFVLQMASIIRDSHFSGTLTLLPDDIMEFLHPGYIERREKLRKENEQEASNAKVPG